jgi:hypothetical protein
MKKLIVVATVSAALTACGGRASPSITTPSGAVTGGSTYGGATYGSTASTPAAP